MSGSREWWVQVSLDDLSDSLDQLETTEERGQWLEGFRVGSRGHAARDEWSPFKRAGFDFGFGCHEEAVEFRLKKSSAGKASADVRRAKYGGAQPGSNRTDAEQCSNTVRTQLRTPNRTDAEQDLEQSPEQSPEQTPNQPTTNNQQLTKNKEQRTKARQAAFDPSMFDALIPVEFSRSSAFVSVWHKWVKHRKERRPMLTESQAEAQLGKLAKDPGSPVEAIEWIEHSIASGYQGVFAPKTFGGFQKPKPKLNGFTPEYMNQGRIERDDGLDF